MEYLIFAGGIGGGMLAAHLSDKAKDEKSKPGIFWLLWLPLTALGVGAGLLLSAALSLD